ncbi:Na(+)/H(+) antiporter subunit F1 [Oceanobacillus alkalisoli]|uniref:Na(+)/H(+) antiporter subunit F1 n=1 Tax=Oceanobacillus alkalisoli TaxID=2925113 RepID=UPI001EF1096D|nr:Na(+)/H(+) antiporter subunit F1 [Oceanobacillus alkalisoli]MCF3943548.1 Na(+)/H(+) antiporter subunit F1 [Oceanobacillus alkalisoli]MCG5102813.1 Na(+)/H(+) antiporter subunit F1 [Oceanobacillus alkalisoli]
MINTLLVTSLILFGVAIAITLIRIIIGPSLPDRVLSLDMIGVQIVSSLAIISILLNTRAFLEVILVLAILAFISTISFTKYIERGVIIERKRDN